VDLIPAAVSVELHHLQSLILDDIMDEDEFRRKARTVHSSLSENLFDQDSTEPSLLYSNNASRLSVSFALMLANLAGLYSLQALEQLDLPAEKLLRLKQIFQQSDIKLYHGQMLDLLYKNGLSSEELSIDDIFNILYLKTGTLFILPALLVAEIGQLSEEKKEDWISFFRNFGILFQMYDDLIDILPRKDRLTGSDFRKRKWTFLTYHTLLTTSGDLRLLLTDPSVHLSDEHIVIVNRFLEQSGLYQKLWQEFWEKGEELLEKIHSLGLSPEGQKEIREIMEPLLSAQRA